MGLWRLGYDPTMHRPMLTAEPDARVQDTKKRRGNDTMPRPTGSDRQGATQRPIQAGAHNSNTGSLEADPALFGSNHAPPRADARVMDSDATGRRGHWQWHVTWEGEAP